MTRKFFADEQVIEMNLVSDFKKLINEKLRKDYQQNFLPASITCLFPDRLKVTEEVEIRPRGQFRRGECDIPPIIINFKTANSKSLKKLGRLKLVSPCGNAPYYEQLVLKEYLAYKIYNLLTAKSFRVRLVKMSYRDIKEKIKPQKMYAFFIEDVDDMAKRSNCEEIKTGSFQNVQTNRGHTTLVSLFQYLIGNTDWSIPAYKNLKPYVLKLIV
ncbi:MAG: hypothetical protein WKI04_15070 [Ferruginibacter sp.]